MPSAAWLLLLLLCGGTTCEPQHPDAGSAGLTTVYAAIEKAFDMLDEYTHSYHRRYTDRQWGIASMRLYNQTKTHFMYRRSRAYALQRSGSQSGPVRSICELGFNAGHSALLMLMAFSDAHVYSFDLGNIATAAKNSHFLARAFPGRFTYIVGDSAKTFPEAVAEFRNHSCDIFFIDGSKDSDARYRDVMASRNLSRPEALLFFDEVNNFGCVSGKLDATSPECQLGLYAACSKSYNQLVKEEFIRVDECITTPTPHDGMCAAYYVK